MTVWSGVLRVVAGVAGAGHSLGEYSAYVAAGSIQLSDAARLVRKRGELMLKAGNARHGTMAAVVGPEMTVWSGVLRLAATATERNPSQAHGSRSVCDGFRPSIGHNRKSWIGELDAG